jgi:hypothetical protein
MLSVEVPALIGNQSCQHRDEVQHEYRRLATILAVLCSVWAASALHFDQTQSYAALACGESTYLELGSVFESAAFVPAASFVW